MRPRARQLVSSGRLTGRMLAWAYHRGVTGRIAGLWRDALTVLCYHRLGEPAPDRFCGFEPNISASPQSFERQIDYICRKFNPISVSQLNSHLADHEPLPPRAVLVTFDDGYKDNAVVAWPILRARNLPAVVFLATDHIGTNRPFLWDFAAYCFQYTRRDFADVPLLGLVPVGTRAERLAATERWVLQSKSLPASERWPAADLLRRSLAVEVPDDAFSDFYMSWDDARRLASEGCDFGGHTKTHPILTTTVLDDARDEIAGSFERIAAELGRPPTAFAYPNGSRQDFTDDHERAARAQGYSMAFSLEPGPTSLNSVRRHPMSIRRIYIGQKDDMPRFAAKLAGASRLGLLMRSRPFQRAA